MSENDTTTKEIPESVKKAVATVAGAGIMVMMGAALDLLHTKKVPHQTLLAKSAEMTAELNRQFQITFRETMERVIEISNRGERLPDADAFSREFKENMAEAGRSCARRVFGFEAQA